MGGNLLLESLGKPIPEQVCSGWHLKAIEEWLLLSSNVQWFAHIACLINTSMLMRHAI